MLDEQRLNPAVRPLAEQFGASTEMLSALADPARQGLIQVLASGELSAGEIAAHFTLSRPTVSHHLGILRRARLVRARKAGKEVYYQLDRERIVYMLQALLDCCRSCCR